MVDLKELKIWDKGMMKLNVDGELKKVYVSPTELVKSADKLHERLKEGKLPIGVDHFPPAVLEHTPILKKLDILNMGDFTGAELRDDGLYALNVTFRNNKLKELYENGEIEDVSIVASSKTIESNKTDYDYILKDIDIYRVDIVGKGACESCKIPKASLATVSASYTKNLKGDVKMALEPNKEPNEPEEPKNGTSLVKELVELMKTQNEQIKAQNEKVNRIFDEIFEIDEAGESDEANEDITGLNVKVKNKKAQSAGVEASGTQKILKEFQDLKKMISDEKQSLENAKIDAYIDSCIQAGKIVPNQTEVMKKLAAADFKSFSEMMKAQKPVIDVSGETKAIHASGDNTGMDDVLDDIAAFNKAVGRE